MAWRVCVAVVLAANRITASCDGGRWGLCFDSQPGTLNSTMALSNYDTSGYASDYDIQATFQVAYGISLGLFNASTGLYLRGSRVTSTFGESTRRDGTVTFTALIHPDLVNKATRFHSMLTPDVFIKNLEEAKNSLTVSVELPCNNCIGGDVTPSPTPVGYVLPTPSPTSVPTTAPPTQRPTTSGAEAEEAGMGSFAILITLFLCCLPGIGCLGFLAYKNHQKQTLCFDWSDMDKALGLNKSETEGAEKKEAASSPLGASSKRQTLFTTVNAETQSAEAAFLAAKAAKEAPACQRACC